MIKYFKDKLDNSFHALTHKNFRYFWMGQCVSLIGTWMQNTCQSWLVYSLTKSAFLLGLVGAIQFTPMLILSLFAGVLIESFQKRKILLITQSVSGILALLLAILVWTNSIQYWHILIFAALLGITNTIDMPTRQSYMVELVGKEDLMNAIALNSSVFNAARVLGPAFAGLMMAWLGIATGFLINALSFAAVIYGIYKIDVPGNPRKKTSQKNVFGDIKEGLVYIYKNEVLFSTLLSVAVIGTFAFNFNVLVPVFAKSVLHQNGQGYGMLMSCMGVGSFLGALTIAANSKYGPMRKILVFSPFVLAIIFTLLGFSRAYILTALLLAISGMFAVSFSSTANSTMQINTKDEFRGRVTSVYTLVFGGTTPIGNLFAGSCAHSLGAPNTFILSGIFIAVFSGAVLTLGKMRKGQAEI